MVSRSLLVLCGFFAFCFLVISGCGQNSSPTPSPTVPSPTFTLSSGSYETTSLTITIECTAESTTVYYTTDESTPTSSSPQYTTSFSIAASKTIKAIAINSSGSSSVSQAIYDLYWWSALGDGMNGIVYALAFHGGSLYAGGEFTTAGGSTAYNIAKWNGISWSNLSSQYVSGAVRAFAFDSSDNLYAAGNFTASINADTTAYNVLKWAAASATYEALGSSLGNTAYALAYDTNNNYLYAGGAFTGTYTAEETFNYLAKWNGTAWSSFSADEPNASVLALSNYSTTYYAGGEFGGIGGLVTGNAAKWASNNWSALSDGVSGTVYSLATDNNEILYAGGAFTEVSGTSAPYIAKWNGSSWSGLSAGLNGIPMALAVDSANNLYIGGSISSAGGVSVRSIARWTGTTWEALGTGIPYSGDNQVYALTVDSSGSLYAGGNFTTAGGVQAYYVAKWGKL